MTTPRRATTITTTQQGLRRAAERGEPVCIPACIRMAGGSIERITLYVVARDGTLYMARRDGLIEPDPMISTGTTRLYGHGRGRDGRCTEYGGRLLISHRVLYPLGILADSPWGRSHLRRTDCTHPAASSDKVVA